MMLASETLLSVQELREICRRHILSLPYVHGTFSNPDVGWLKEEYANVVEKLQINSADFDHNDVRDAFYSCVFELEFNKLFLPNSLVATETEIGQGNGKPTLSRLIRFSFDYPRVLVKDYLKSGIGVLKRESETRLLTECQLVCLTDPLARKDVPRNTGI